MTGLRGTALMVAGAMIVAGASLLVGQALRFDPHGWLLWGREIALGQGTFDTSGYPSWKPLPLLLAVPLAVTGSAAPTLWLFVMRTTGLLALVAVLCLTARRAGALAGIVAAGLLALTPAWWPTTLGGGIEPALVALGCWAVAAHERGRPGRALALLAIMALGREEALLLVLAYGFALRRRGRWLLPAATAASVGVGAAWLGGDWLGSGDPLRGGDLARAALAETPFSHFDRWEMAVAVIVAPAALILLLLGITVAARARDRLILAITAAAFGWIAIDIALLTLGYPVPARFLLPAAAACSVVAGIGVSAAPRALAWAAGNRTGPAPSVESTR